VRQKTALLLVLFFLVPSFAGESTAVLHKRVTEVRVNLVATDQYNRPLPSLSPADIAVMDDGHTIPYFELRSVSDLPLRLGIVLDLSDSTRKSWPVVRNPLMQSLRQVIRPRDEILVLTFSSDIATQRTLTEPGQLDAVLENPAEGGLTALYDSLYRTCDHSLFTGDAEPHRSALILFSDGEDDLSRHTLNDAIAKAQATGIAIYALSNHNPKRQKPGDVVLRDLAGATGGRDFVVKNAQQLQEALAAINVELRSSYLLYYHPPDESGTRAFRRIFVVPTQSNGSRMRSRTGYFTDP
jgi:Ca-activated chloride channel homolog